MQIKFYIYNNLDIAPNKLKNATNVETINIDAPQIMQNLGISFLLDRAIEANIAEYWLKGIQYIAYVDYSTSGNNMYTYKLSIDALATAWYNKCFDRTNIITRSSDGNPNKIYDSALTYADKADITTYNFTDGATERWIALNVLSAQVTETYSTYRLDNPAIMTYLLTLSQYKTFFNKFLSESAANQNNYGPSVLSVYFIDSNMLPNSLFKTVGGTKVKLYAFNRELYGDLTLQTKSWTEPVYDSLGNIVSEAVYVEKAYGNPANFTLDIDLGTGQVIQQLNTTYTNPNIFNRITTNVNMEITPSNYKTNFSLYVRNVGVINFSAAELNTKTITKVGYDICADPLGGTVRAYLVVNNTRYENKFIQGQLGTSAPFVFDNSVTNWTNLIGNAVVSTASQLALAVVPGATGAALVSAGITAIGQGVSIAAALQDEKNGSYATVGTGGNSIDQVSAKNSVLTVSTIPALNTACYHSRFGKPDYRCRNIFRDIPQGYVQTADCLLNMNNLNIDIIQSATNQCDNGIWIL